MIPNVAPPPLNARCDWQDATPSQRERWPESVLLHSGHQPGESLAQCDAWVCPCGNTPSDTGFVQVDDLIWCDRCYATFDLHGQRLTD